MQLRIEWNKPLILTAREDGFGYALDLDRFEKKPAIYVFYRQWGKKYEALYVGQTTNLRARLRNHLNNLELMRHLHQAKTGQRVLIVGHPNARQGQKISKILPIIEKTLIRHFVSEGHNLSNKQGKKIRTHEVLSEGAFPKSFVPSGLHVEE